MAWDFETEPEFQAQLDWMDEFVREEIEPLDFILGHPNDFTDPKRARLIPPLQEQRPSPIPSRMKVGRSVEAACVGPVNREDLEAK